MVIMNERFKNIVGKKAHWGRYTFKARKYNKTGVSLSVWSNCPEKFEAQFMIRDITELVDLSVSEESSLRFYTGSLVGQRNASGDLKKPEWIPTIEYFLACFKY
jgi:hypothetical protein